MNFAQVEHMEAERWKQIEALYQAAMAEPEANRGQFIRQACPDPGLRDAVESLLKCASDDSSFLERSPIVGESDPESTQGPKPEAATEVMIGRYRLLQKIGEGGMGEVWLAEQKEPVRRRVALKLVKAGMNTRQVIARFESERQALALMDHPAIARVFDAGSTAHGTPYFVMEYVAGVPITAYCDHHRLNTRERLELFMQVCEGVQHAHQKAIIHRDLKPSNILVTEVDGRSAPKIIDFGVAKALTQKLTPDTMFTRAGVLIGTPEYMSPEQTDSSGEDIDTRTDVYSLGIIFYELLAGAPPIELRKIPFEEFLRRLREEEPPKPSTRIRTQDPATSTEVARRRQSEPLTLAKQMRGDLDSIALKALEKDRSRRYDSPSAFAADIRRYLNHEAVLAVPTAAAYRARKFARRHRGALATSGAFALVLIAAAGISVWQSIRATRQRNRADAEAAAAQAVNDFLQNDLLAQANSDIQAPNTRPDPDLTVRIALDRAAARIAGKFDRQPEVEAAIRNTVGQAYINLGHYPQAREQLESALRLERRVLGPDSPKTLATMVKLGEVAWRQGQLAEAEALLVGALESSRRVFGPEHRDTLTCMWWLTVVYDSEGKRTQSAPLYKQLVEIRSRVLGPDHVDTLIAMVGALRAHKPPGVFKEYEVLYKRIIEKLRRQAGPENTATLEYMDALARVYNNEDRIADAVAEWTETLEIKRRVLGPEHPDTLLTMNNLAFGYINEHKYAKAKALYTQTLEINRRNLGPEHPDTLGSMGSLANVYLAEGQHAKAEVLQRQTLELKRKVLGPESFSTLRSVYNLGRVYTARGKYVEEEALFRNALLTSPNNPTLLNNLAWYLLSVPDRRLRRPKEALQLARQLVKGSPDNGGYYNTLGLAEYRNDLWDDAIAALGQSVEKNNGSEPTDFFFLAMAHWKRGDKGDAEIMFQRGVEKASKDAPDEWEWRMFWAEAAELLGKPGPVPTLFEVRAEPKRAMAALRRAAAAGQLKLATLQTSPDLAPLRGSSDFQVLLQGLRSWAKLPAH